MILVPDPNKCGYNEESAEGGYDLDGDLVQVQVMYCHAINIDGYSPFYCRYCPVVAGRPCHFDEETK